MIFADGRESVCNLQSEMEFKIGEVKSKATFRLITNLLPGLDLILGKTWLKEAKPVIDFESVAVQVNGLHALNPKVELPTPTPISATDLLALATILATAVATTTVTSGKVLFKVLCIAFAPTTVTCTAGGSTAGFTYTAAGASQQIVESPMV